MTAKPASITSLSITSRKYQICKLNWPPAAFIVLCLNCAAAVTSLAPMSGVEGRSLIGCHRQFSMSSNIMLILHIKLGLSGVVNIHKDRNLPVCRHMNAHNPMGAD